MRIILIGTIWFSFLLATRAQQGFELLLPWNDVGDVSTQGLMAKEDKNGESVVKEKNSPFRCFYYRYHRCTRIKMGEIIICENLCESVVKKMNTPSRCFLPQITQMHTDGIPGDT